MSDEDRTKRTERHIIREERLSRPEKMALEDRATQPGAEYVEVGWRKTAPEDLAQIRRRVDELVGREGRTRPAPPPGRKEDLPAGLRSRIVEAYGSVAYVRLAYSTKDHHVCRVGLREDGRTREIVVLVTPDDVQPADTVETAVDGLPAVHPSRVRIASTQFDPPGHDEGSNLVNEWVEVRNRGDEPVDLTGWRLEDKSGKAYTFPDGFTLQPHASVRVRTGEGKDTDTSLYWGRRAAVWNNQGDTATLVDAEGERVHRVEWAPPA